MAKIPAIIDVRLPDGTVAILYAPEGCWVTMSIRKWYFDQEA